jgi:hypothetical protein
MTVSKAQFRAEMLSGWRDVALKGLKGLTLAALFLLCMA